MGTGFRTTPKNGLAVVVAVALAVALATTMVVGLVTTDVGATHEQERTTDGFKGYTTGGDIPNPGDNMTVQLYMVPAFMDREGPIPPDVEVKIDYQAYYTTTTSHCDTQDVYALGVDRENDDPNTRTDDDLVQSLMRNGDSERTPDDDPAQMTTNDDWTHRQYTWLELADEEDFPETMHLNEGGTEDETILAVSDCVEMPDAGWHRTFGKLNGTIKEFHSDREEVVIDGESHQVGDHFEIWEPSRWYPVCDCDESRHVAMRLGPPPGPMTPGSEGGIIHPNGTMEAPYGEINESGWVVYPNTSVPPEHVTSDGIHFEDGFLELSGPIYYGAGHIEADGTIVTPSGQRYEPDEDESPPPPTPTATPTPTPTPVETTPTPTPTPADENDEPPTPTATGGGGDDGEDGVRTPTPGDGPGFGHLAALLALLAATALRRRG